MPGNSRVIEPERIMRAFNPISVSSSRRCSLHETSFQTYQALHQKLETLDQQMDELSILLAQSNLAQLQSISAAVHFESATINIPSDSDTEPMTPPTKDMWVDPIFLDTTTMSMADTLPLYHNADYGLLEGNAYSSDAKGELITTLPSTSSMKGERVPLTPIRCSAMNCGRSLFSNAVLEAETASTTNLLEYHLSTTPTDSGCNSHFPGTKSLVSTSKLLPNLLKESIEPRSAKHGLQDFLLAKPPKFITWLPGS